METKVCRLYGQEDLRIETDSVEQPESNQVLVRVGRGGICGSDLHYYLHGGIGKVRVSEPIIMGHEFAGTVEAVGSGITDLAPGDLVGINPSQPCGNCDFCKKDQPQHCYEMRFIGSAFRTPHEQGGFRERIIVDGKQCIKGSGDITVAELASAEPLAVCLHAAKKAGNLKNKKILVNGAGPIGAMCTAISEHFGAAEIVTVDLADKPLDIAKQLGATNTINIIKNPEQISPYAENKGYFDVIFECSAAQAAMATIFNTIKPQGTIVQVGVTGSVEFPMGLFVSKEITWIGTHRFHHEYAEAVQLISEKKINVKPMITDVFPFTDVHKAIKAATNREQSVKVQVSFEG